MHHLRSIGGCEVTNLILFGGTMHKKYSILAALGILALVLSACGSANSPSTVAARTISINGAGTVYLTPDIAYINIGVHTEDPVIGLAVDHNNQKSQAVIKAIKDLGVAEKDIQTTNFSINNSIQYDPNTSAEIGTIFQVDNTVVVTMRDIGKLSQLLDSAIQAGANNINSVVFDVADKSAAVQQARLLALKNAHDLASELTTGMGVTLGAVQSLSYYDTSPSPYFGKGGESIGNGNSTTPINAGQMQLTVNVSITYEIK
jgi:hypothetical protein